MTPQAALSLHTGHLWCCFSVWWCFNKNFKICIIFHLCSCCVSVCVLRSFRSWSGCCASCSVWPPSPRGPWSPTLHSPSAPLYVHTNMINNLQVKPHRGHVSSNHASLLSCSLSSPARWPWRQGDALPSHWWVLEKPERGCVSDRSANWLQLNDKLMKYQSCSSSFLDRLLVPWPHSSHIVGQMMSLKMVHFRDG